MPEQTKPETILYLLPGKDKNNKYFELFEKSMGEFSSKVYFVNTHMSLFSLVRAGEYKEYKNKELVIFWSTILYGSAYSLKSLHLIICNALLLIYLKKTYGFRVSWIINNNFAHDYPHPAIDKLGRWTLGKFTDRFIVQQKSTKEIYSKKYPNAQILFARHPNYTDAYGPVILNNQEIRELFGYKKDNLVLLSLGAIRPYKKLEKVIKVFMSCRRPDLRLLIAGKGNEEYVSSLQKLADSDNRIKIINQFVSDSDMPKYLAVADYSIFYFDESELTSGAVMLSLSYGVPVVCRNLPPSEVVIKKNVGFAYGSDEELKKLLLNLSPFSKTKEEIISCVAEINWRSNVKKLISRIS